MSADELGEKRATYRELLSPLAQIVAATDFVGQMESIVADEWRESDDLERRAKAAAPSALNFLEALQEQRGELFLCVLAALKESGLRCEVDGELESEGYFNLRRGNEPVDLLLYAASQRLHEQVKEFAPEGWTPRDTRACLAWENLVVVPDEEGIVARACLMLAATDVLPAAEDLQE
jgi:hypothetical protein